MIYLLVVFSAIALFVIVNVNNDNFIASRIESISADVETVVVEQNNEREDMAGSGRWGIWRNTLPFVQEYWLIGSGPSTFSIVYYDRYPTEEINVDNSHNEYLEIAFSMGVPALLLFLAIHFTVLKEGFTKLKYLKGEQQIYLFGLLVTIIGYMIKINFNISVLTVAPFFWVIFGMCYAFSVKHKW